jgi:branched-chain amino acid transport system permease protein
VTAARRAARPTAIGLVVGVLVSGRWWLSEAQLLDLVQFFSYLAMAQMWNLLAGYAGLVSIGQQAYVGVGAYGLYWLSDSVGLDPFAAVPLAAVVAAVISVPVAVLAFRLRGGYFAIGTWVIAEVFRLTLANVSAVGGGSGTSLTALRGIPRATRESATFFLCLGGAAASLALVYGFLRSREGLSLLALRDDEMAAESQGVDVRRTKLAVYLFAAGGAGLAGALYFLGNLRISPDAAFSVNWTAFSIFIVLIGGAGTLEGTIVGSALFYLLTKLFSDYGTWYLVGLGMLAVVVTVKLPRGLWGTVSDRLDLHLFPVQRRLRLPDQK